MPKIEFHHNDRPTVGIELELGLIDAKTKALTSSFGLLYGRLIGEGKHEGIKDSLKPELMQRPHLAGRTTKAGAARQVIGFPVIKVLGFEFSK